MNGPRNRVLERKKQLTPTEEHRLWLREEQRRDLMERANLERTRQCAEVWHLCIDQPWMTEAKASELESLLKEVLTDEWGPGTSVVFDRGFKTIEVSHEDGRRRSL